MSYVLIFLFGMACGFGMKDMYETIKFDLMIMRMHKDTMEKGRALLSELEEFEKVNK